MISGKIIILLMIVGFAVVVTADMGLVTYRNIVPAQTNPLPDLVALPHGVGFSINNVLSTSANGTLYNVSLKANIKNNGNSAAATSITRFNIEGHSVPNITTPSLAPGQTQGLSYFVNLNSGTYMVDVTTDVNGNVQESNELNNDLSYVIDLT